jgi:uncharacterized damage-inducible protein DinB
MNREILESLYDYAVWANERLLDGAARLPTDDLGRQLSKGYQSIHATLVHLVSADLRWFARWRNEALPPMLTPADLPTLDALRARWTPHWGERRGWIAGLTDAQLTEPIRFTGARGEVTFPRWQGMLQCANHGTQHRSEIAAMLTDLGQSPGDLDYILFCQPRR